MARTDDEDPMNWLVGDFLREMREVISVGLPGTIIWHEAARRDAEIADLNLTKPLVLEELPKLTAAHHQAGPEKDDWDENCVVQKFRYPLERYVEVYVKIGLKQRPARRGIYVVKIYSFKRWN